METSIKTPSQKLRNTLIYTFLIILWARQLLKNLPPESVCDKAVTNIEIRTKDSHLYCQAKRSLTVSNYIVEKLLGITVKHKVDLKSLIAYYPPGKLSSEKAKAYPVIINFKPLSLDKIITLAKAQKILPPKSSFILPKLPTGLYLSPLAKGQIK